MENEPDNKSKQSSIKPGIEINIPESCANGDDCPHSIHPPKRQEMNPV